MDFSFGHAARLVKSHAGIVANSSRELLLTAELSAEDDDDALTVAPSEGDDAATLLKKLNAG